MVCTGGLLAVVSMAYDPALVGTHYVPRFSLLYPLILTVVVLVIIEARRAGEAACVDLLDLLALAFAAWQVLSAVLSPSPVLAWFGYYNRGTGALFWVALALLFVATRRLLDRPRGRQALAWSASAVLLVAGAIAVAQVAGAVRPLGRGGGQRPRWRPHRQPDHPRGSELARSVAGGRPAVVAATERNAVAGRGRSAGRGSVSRSDRFSRRVPWRRGGRCRPRRSLDGGAPPASLDDPGVSCAWSHSW